ncbi:MAG: PQQ-binding-like beta-propeller repeat protein [Limisphaerales bacterium]
MKPPTVLLSLLAAAHLSGAAEFSNPADRNWPQWRGPAANGAAPHADPPTEWSETKNVKWKVKLPGSGSATPIIWGDRIFVLTAVPTGKKPGAAAAPAPAAVAKENAEPQKAPSPGGAGGKGGKGGKGGGGGFGIETPTEVQRFAVLCLDRKTGRTLWDRTVREAVPNEGHHRDHGWASGSAITDGQWLIAPFGSHGIYALDLDGNIKWQRELGRQRTRSSFGEGSSAALHGDTVVMNWDHEGEDFIVALDKRTGADRWRNSRDEITTWSTPLIVEHEGKAQVVVNATGAVRGYDLASGKPLWEAGGQSVNAIPSPVTTAGLVIVMSGYTKQTLQAIRLGRTGKLDGTDAIAWSHNKATPYVPSPLLYGDRLYFLASNNGVLSCFDVRTGKAHFEAQRLEGMRGVYASPLGAAGRVYVVGRDGTTLVLKDGAQFEPLATNRLGEGIDASPVAVGRELFLRGKQHLYCIAEK